MTAQPAPEHPFDDRVRVWARRIVVAIGIIGLLVLAGWIGASVIPRWWSHRIGDQVRGSIVAGIFIGLVYGFLFTALPLLVLWRGLRRRRRWRVWAMWVVGAIVLALPNLFTLAIVLGGGHAAHAGERTFDVEAPAFRGASLAGAIVAVIAVGALMYLVISGRRSRLQLRRLRAEVDAERKQPPAEA